MDSDEESGSDTDDEMEDFLACAAGLEYDMHAKNTISGRIISFLVLGFWDKNAGSMPYRWNVPATSRI